MFTITVDTGRFVADAEETKLVLRRTAGVAAVAGGRLGHLAAKTSRAFQDRTGKLRSKITVTYRQVDRDSFEATIDAKTSYAIFVEAGTQAHQIAARDPHSKPLRFFWRRAGRWFRGPYVNHPGTQPHPFMGPAYFKAEAAARARFDAGLGEALAIWR